ncbi:protease HtpX [Massilia terrae]|uniref:Protease HtpX homolog n=1 Tax=Massilia terrae TaxID=1811224 RepID=A0ABT2CY36_9BURK|nr:protease HtpX [Massilia terrae]MCS0658013.1 protease HtpX [Massilia terrae]
MKRIILFLATNLAVVLVLTIVLNLLGVGRAVGPNNMTALLVFSVVVGFTGSIISLLMSKLMAKWSTGARVITQPANSTELWLVNTVQSLANRAGIGMPEVAVYDGEPNAFATGAFKNSALVAVSTGLLSGMNHEEIEAVLGHEISHVANGDMVTLTLIQGVVNTFVVFLSRVVGFFVDQVLLRNNDSERRGPGIGYMISVFVCEIVFGIVASMIVAWFSRWREFRADAGSARLLNSTLPMQHALARLGQMQGDGLPQSMQAFGISGGGSGWGALFASHPPLEERIAALQQLRG